MENYRKYIEKVLDKNIAKALISFIEVNAYESIKQRRNSFYYGEYIKVEHTALLNIGLNAASINEIKLSEIKDMCNIFDENEFFFISDWIKENDIDGISLKYDSNITWDRFSLGMRHFGNYFNSNLPGNWWVGQNWCRYISEAMSDSYSHYYDKIIDIPHELIATKKQNFKAISKIYEKKYGVLAPVLQYKDFLEKILESEFDYLLSDNIYITNSSIDFIKSQILNNLGKNGHTHD